MQKCQEFYCPWVRDSRDPDRYMCLKCGRDRRVSHLQDWQGIFLLLPILAFIAALLAGCAVPVDEVGELKTRELPARSEYLPQSRHP